MRSNVVTEANLSTRVSQWWTSVPFVTSVIVLLCGVIYIVCLLFGYDSFFQVCFLPSAVPAKFEVYRIYTSTVFHVSILHLVFNMLALVPIGSGLERILGSIRYAHALFLIATFNGVLHLLVALLAAHNPIYPYGFFMNECSVGFSGMIFAMIVMETNLSGVQNRSIFGFFNVPAKWYAWILLILFQLLMPNVSLLGHLCGILSGFAYTYGIFNPLLFGSSTYSALESSWVLACCVRRPGFIVGGGVASGTQLPTFSPPAGNNSVGNLWRSFRSWVPQREMTLDERFPGRGRTLAGVTTGTHSTSVMVNESGLQARLLDNDSGGDADGIQARDAPVALNTRSVQNSYPPSIHAASQNQDSQDKAEALSSLAAMGFDQKKAEVALDAANGDLAMAVEILSSQVP